MKPRGNSAAHNKVNMKRWRTHTRRSELTEVSLDRGNKAGTHREQVWNQNLPAMSENANRCPNESTFCNQLYYYSLNKLIKNLQALQSCGDSLHRARDICSRPRARLHSSLIWLHYAAWDWPIMKAETCCVRDSRIVNTEVSSGSWLREKMQISSPNSFLFLKKKILLYCNTTTTLMVCKHFAGHYRTKYTSPLHLYTIYQCFTCLFFTNPYSY